MKGINYILSIAIDEYKDESFKKLSNAKLDIERFQNILIDNYGFEIIQDSIVDSNATRKKIIEALENLSGILTPRDNLILYFAGHGKIHPKTKLGFWIPFDGTSTSTHNYINNSTVIDIIRGVDAKHILIISDSCFSGTFIIESRGDNLEKHYSKIEEKPSRWLLASGRDETVSDGQPGSGSPFANSLVLFLENNRNKYVSLSELSIQVRKETSSIANQTPMAAALSYFGNSGGEFVFKLNPKIGKSNKGWESKFNEFCDSKKYRPEWPYISKENPETKTLGIWCVDQRRFKRLGKLSPEKEHKLLDAGFIFNPNVQKFFTGFGKFLAFMHNTGYNYMPNHLRDKYNEEYAWLSLQQKQYRKNPCNANDPKSYPKYRYDILKKNGIDLNANRYIDTWPQFKIDLAAFYQINEKFISIPSQVSKDKQIAELGNRLNDYMVSWKKDKLSKEKIDFISRFVDKDYLHNKHKRSFEKRIIELKEFQKGNRNKIPKQGKGDFSGLGQWYAQIMTALKQGTSKKLPEWKINRLIEENIIVKI